MINLKHPVAITMWDFSWLERRWTGAGYESWEQALDELKERGYDAVRIDAYPHLLAVDPDKEWELQPEWSVQVWGAPAITRVRRIKEHLLEFIRLCKERGIWVGLSTWFREDRDNTRLGIHTPQDLGRIWLSVLDAVDEAGLMDQILYVDLCNEYPLDCWAPFLGPAVGKKEVLRTSEEGSRWMRESIALLRDQYPDLSYCFSFCNEFQTYKEQDVSYMGLLELHIWMAQWSEFYEEVGYQYERFSAEGYTNLALKGEPLYRSKPEYWQEKLREGIRLAADWSRLSGKPLITTECWGIVDYKDWPLLEWDWIKELCEIGVKEALATGRWVGVATSNFCGPQFVGMWRDVEWHRRLTSLIRAARIDGDLLQPKRPVG